MGEFTTCNRCDLAALQRRYGADNVRLEPSKRVTFPDAVRATHAETGEFLGWFGSIPEECCCG